MSWTDWGEFVAMGGHGLYVWGAYLVALVVLLVEVILLMLRARNIRRFLGAAHWLDRRSQP